MRRRTERRTQRAGHLRDLWFGSLMAFLPSVAGCLSQRTLDGEWPDPAATCLPAGDLSPDRRIGNPLVILPGVTLPLESSPDTGPEDDGDNAAVFQGTPRFAAAAAETPPGPSEGPRAIFTGPAYSRVRPTELRYALIGGRPDDIEKVEVLLRAPGEREWRAGGTWEETRSRSPGAEGRIPVDLPDGTYRVAVVPWSRSGRRSASPPVSGRLVVDTVPPSLTVNVDGEVTPGEPLRLPFSVSDTPESDAPAMIPVWVEHSVDGGESWFLLGLERSSPFRWIVPPDPGLHLLRFSAGDEAGNRAEKVVPIRVFPCPVRLRLRQGLEGVTLRGGGPCPVAWTTVPGGVDWTVTVEFSRDCGKNWQVLAGGQEASGQCVVKLPGVDSRRCRIRVCPEGSANPGDESGEFTVSTRLPEVEIPGPIWAGEGGSEERIGCQGESPPGARQESLPR